MLKEVGVLSCVVALKDASLGINEGVEGFSFCESWLGVFVLPVFKESLAGRASLEEPCDAKGRRGSPFSCLLFDVGLAVLLGLKESCGLAAGRVCVRCAAASLVPARTEGTLPCLGWPACAALLFVALRVTGVRASGPS